MIVVENMENPTELDNLYFVKLRENIKQFLQKSALKYSGKILEIAPQVYNDVAQAFPGNERDTLDIDKDSKATFITDLCIASRTVPNESYDILTCLEVLEHVAAPWLAVKEIYKLLKPGGIVLVSTPLNFYIHPPYPDYWRFTEFGLRELFKDFEDIELEPLLDENRKCLPIQYVLSAKKPI